MLIYPAIDIRNGQCVRLVQGQDSRQTVYGKDPVAMAQVWKSEGATHIHVADLDGAFQRRPMHIDTVARIRKETGLPVQMGGGFRTIDQIAEAVSKGIDRVILGTIAVTDPDLVRTAAKKFGAQVTVSIDVKDEFVTVAGWQEVSTIRYTDLATRMREAGIQELLYTDTRKDGTLSGPNIEGLQTFLAAAQIPVVAGGGVTTVEDIVAMKALTNRGLKGAVIGKALYDHRIALKDALAAAK